MQLRFEFKCTKFSINVDNQFLHLKSKDEETYIKIALEDIKAAGRFLLARVNDAE